jgi:hypothetical protein
MYSTEVYGGRLRAARIALFCIICNRSQILSFAVSKAGKPYVMIVRTIDLYIFSIILSFGSVVDLDKKRRRPIRIAVFDSIWFR